MPHQVRDARQPGHFWADNELVDNHLPQIGVFGFAVYMLLARYADNTTGQCEPSIGLMAKQLSVSAPTVRKALETLRDCGLIAIRHRKKERDGKLVNQTSIYTILAVTKSKTGHGTKPDLVPNEIDQGTKPGLVPTKPGLVGVLNQVSSNNTGKTLRKDIDRAPRKSADAPRAQEPKERTPHQAIMDAYQEALGYPIPDGAAAGKAAKELVALGYTPEQVAECYVSEKAREFWQDKHLSLMSLKKNIGAWAQSRARVSTKKSNPMPLPTKPNLAENPVDLTKLAAMAEASRRRNA